MIPYGWFTPAEVKHWMPWATAYARVGETWHLITAIRDGKVKVDATPVNNPKRLWYMYEANGGRCLSMLVEPQGPKPPRSERDRVEASQAAIRQVNTRNEGE